MTKIENNGYFALIATRNLRYISVKTCLFLHDEDKKNFVICLLKNEHHNSSVSCGYYVLRFCLHCKVGAGPLEADAQW